jgi:glycosyltransferase involved in cell wall biosynthesis
VLPYTDATQSGVAAIALANSRPVIASNAGDLPDIVQDGRTGLLVPPCDARSLADAMERLLADEPLRSSLAMEAGRYARDRLLWPRIAELTVGTYQRALESRQLADKARPLVADDSG